MVVVPCFNEERRLDVRRLTVLAESGRVRLLFVNDGSTDGTLPVLTRLRDSSGGVEVLDLRQNVGKAEAVRRGLVHAIATGAPVVGYYDADLATPPDEFLRLVDVLQDKPEVEFVLAARVALLGRRIERKATRHYLGRVFASLASGILGIRVYDTQCGAKVFRVTPAVVESLSQPFRSTWVFDVELIGRLLRGSNLVEPVPQTAFEEVPLREWLDVSGSKLSIVDMGRALADLILVGAELRSPRRPRI